MLKIDDQKNVSESNGGEYIMFLDESGDHSLSKIDLQFPVFTLAGCIFEKEYYQKIAIPKINVLKQDIFRDTDIILHSHEIRKTKGDFRDLLNPHTRKRFIEAMNQLMSDLEFTIISSCIRKDLLVENYFSPDDPYDLSFSFLIERFVKFLQENNGVGEFSFESRDSKSNTNLLKTYNWYKESGNSYCQPYFFNEHINGISFVEKLQNINGHQIADLVAYPIARYCINSNKKNSAFEILKPKFRRSGSRVKGFGYKEFP